MPVDIAAIEKELEELLDFEEVGSVDRARKFITVANKWLAFKAESASHQSSSMTIGKSYVVEMIKRAHNFVASHSRSSGVRHLGVGRGFR